MEPKKLRIAFAVCIVLFITALVLTTVFSNDETQSALVSGSGHVVLSEILASNRTYPAPDGRYLDFIEVHNLSGTPTDISGYKLSDNATSIGFTFPQGTIIPAYGYAICWCDKTSDSDSYASFGISKDGGETILLYNSANVLIDEILVPRVEPNVSLIRLEDGSWTTSVQATPGYENTEAGYEAWLRAMGGDQTLVVISEIMTSNSCTVINADGQITDWVELWNTGDTVAMLGGAYLSNDLEDPAKWRLPELQLEPGERLVIPCVGSGAKETEASFALSRSGCTITLTGALGNILSRVECPPLETDCSWALQSDGSYQQVQQATPGYENTEEGVNKWVLTVGGDLTSVVISEIQTRNRSAITDAAGRLCDWVELWNTGDSVAVLDGAYLTDDPLCRSKWQIPNMRLEPGQRAVIRCVGRDAAANEANFALPGSGCSLVLTGRVGNIIHQVECPQLGEDRVWALQENGTYLQTEMATPGYENTERGWLFYLAYRKPSGPLVISEVMPSNNRYLRQSDGKCYDWVELLNDSASAINLSDYALSDNADYPNRFPLPQQTLAPGERVVVICSGGADLTGGIHAPFTLSREESWVYVTGPDGRLCDYLRIYDVPYQHSVGRETGKNEVCYFTTPTPGQENGTGTIMISQTPTVLTADGVFDGVQSVSVKLDGAGELHYTLDGSMPTQDSALYKEPILLTTTTVVRVAGFEEGKLRSDVVTASYIINENHTLPVLSLTLEPTDLYGGRGIYTKYTEDIEVPCNLKLFENGAGFSIDCGVKLYGHMGLKDPKKNFKVNFRGAYGAKYLSYPVYGEDGPQIYDSLCIRAGQDYPRAIFRDELFTSLSRQMSNNVLAQRDKFCILYVNGSYFGIYCLKEAFTEVFYAQNNGVSEESVTVVQAPVGVDSEFYTLLRYCWGNDLSIQENYDYVASQVDIDSLIDWMIIEGYCTNVDVQQNLRYFKSSENGGKWQLAYYDLDWAFYNHAPYYAIFSTKQILQHMGLTRSLMENPGFRQRFLERLSEVLSTTLSDENVIAQINAYEKLLDPEVPREREHWGGSYNAWKREVQGLRSFLTDEDHLGTIVTQLRDLIGLTNEEVKTYFWRWV